MSGAVRKKTGKIFGSSVFVMPGGEEGILASPGNPYRRDEPKKERPALESGRAFLGAASQPPIVGKSEWYRGGGLAANPLL